MNKEKLKEELIKKYKQHAKKNGFRLNPDKNIVDSIIDLQIKNKEEKGEFYCPCRRVTGNKEEDKKIICPCVYHKEEINKFGHCHCFLFVK